MEMQIFHTDDFKKSKSKENLVISILFNVGKTHNSFFDFLEKKEADLDIGLLIPVDYMMTQDLFGYLGTTTQPPCTTGVGWYIVPKIQELT